MRFLVDAVSPGGTVTDLGRCGLAMSAATQELFKDNDPASTKFRACRLQKLPSLGRKKWRMKRGSCSVLKVDVQYFPSFPQEWR